LVVFRDLALTLTLLHCLLLFILLRTREQSNFSALNKQPSVKESVGLRVGSHLALSCSCYWFCVLKWQLIASVATAIYSLGHWLHTLATVPRLTQPSMRMWMVVAYQWTHSPRCLTWFEGWQPSGAEFIKQTG